MVAYCGRSVWNQANSETVRMARPLAAQTSSDITT